MSLEDLRAFLAVAEHGSFLRAAVSLGVSRTTLRRQVEALEAQAGVSLVRRASGGVELTDGGRMLLGGGQRIEQEFAGLLRAVRETSRHPSGDVAVLLQSGLPPAALAAVGGFFHTAWPQIRLNVHFSENPLGTAGPDTDVVGWIGQTDAGPVWTTYALMPLRQRLLASQDYLDRRGTPHSIGDLADHTLLVWGAPGVDPFRIADRTGASIAVDPALTIADAHVLHLCAQQGMGIAWAPDAGSPMGHDEVPLVALLEDDVGVPLDLRIAVPSALATIPRLRVFADSIRSMREAILGLAL